MGDAPSAGHVRFRVQICGVCHSDLLGVESQRRIHRRWPLLATRTVQRRMRARAKQITLGVVAEPDRASHKGCHMRMKLGTSRRCWWPPQTKAIRRLVPVNRLPSER
jgi:hypothetical protein